MTDVAVLIPCYNEARTIGKVVADFRRVLPTAIVYVYDNNSTDDTAKLAAAAGAVVRHEPMQGKANVIRTMFYEIDAMRYLMVDGDDTYPAEDAPKLLKSVSDGIDMVIGDRLSSTYAEENKRPFHTFGNSLVRLLVNKCFNGSVIDIMTGYRAFSRRFVKSCPVLSAGFEVETEMTIHALDKRLRIVSCPIAYRDRPIGSISKLNTYRDGFKVLLTIFNLIKEYRPLLFFSVAALLLACVAVLLVTPVFVSYFKTGLVPRFPTLIVAGFLMITSVMTFFLGIVLDIIAHKSRQQFEIDINLMAVNDRRGIR